MIKAVFFDIDGTLVSFNTHKVPESTREALAKLRNNGIKTFIASGRHLASINNLPNLEFDGYVLINGAFAFMNVQKDYKNPDGREVIYRHPIPKEDVESWLNFIKENPKSTVLVYEKNLTMNFKDEVMQEIFDLLNFPEPLVGNLEDLKEEEIFQIIATFTDEESPEMMKNLPNCKTSRWHPRFTDINESHCSKARGIQAVMEYFGWTKDEVMSFGDGGNDVDMLQMAGVGVAMGNSDESVKQHADYITASVDDDGVYKALKHFDLI